MNKAFIPAVIGLLLFVSSGEALKIGEKDILNLDLTSAVISNSVQGNEGSSILTPGLFSEHYLTGSIIKNFDSFYIRANTTAKYTDEPNLKGQDYFELQKFLVETGSGFNKITAGDFFTTYSRYTMGQTARGAMAKVSLMDYQVTPFIGRVVVPRENAAFARYAGGIRVNKRFFGRALEVGINYVNAADDQGSITDSTGLLNVLKNNIYGADFKYTLSRDFRFEGELSQVFQKNESTGDETSDIALFLRNLFQYQGFRGFAEFERVGSQFNSLTGFASPDKLVIKGNLYKYLFNRMLKAYVYGERYNNNVNGDMTDTLVTFTPKVGLDFFYKGMGINLMTKLTDRNDNVLIDNANLVYAANSFFKAGMVCVNASYEHADYQDERNNDNDYSTDYILGDVKVPFVFKTGVLNQLTPGVGYSLNFSASG